VFTVLLDVPGGRPAELTPIAETVTFATAAVGGFGDASFAVEGNQTRLLTHLARVKIMFGTWVCWDGRIEDVKLSITAKGIQTNVTCFGMQRLLVDNSVRRIWMKRDIDWVASQIGNSAPLFNNNTGGGGATNLAMAREALPVTTGRFDEADSTKTGVKFVGNGVAVGQGFGNQAQWPIPIGLTLIGFRLDVAASGANMGGTNIVAVFDADNYPTTSTFSFGATTDGGGTFTNPLAGIMHIGAVNISAGSLTPASTEKLEITNIRLFGVALSLADVFSGFYGGTILRNLLALCPGLTEGIVESGSDFTIQAIERTVRDTCLSVVQEVAGYYAREWAVWEDGRFDWKTPNLDEPQWTIAVADCNELEIETSVDTLTKTAYVLYTDAASGVDAEASAASTSQRNPFVKQSAAKDALTNAGFPMTANTSSQYATQLAAARGKYPPVIGRVVLPAARLVKNAVGSTQPAATIRAGRNLFISDLPKTEVFVAGRDGETLFHIASTEVNMEAGEITLELEGQGREIDVISARLAAATRVLTG
jgi:hypothetical protein